MCYRVAEPWRKKETLNTKDVGHRQTVKNIMVSWLCSHGLRPSLSRIRTLTLLWPAFFPVSERMQVNDTGNKEIQVKIARQL